MESFSRLSCKALVVPTFTSFSVALFGSSWSFAGLPLDVRNPQENDTLCPQVIDGLHIEYLKRRFYKLYLSLLAIVVFNTYFCTKTRP